MNSFILLIINILILEITSSLENLTIYKFDIVFQCYNKFMFTSKTICFLLLFISIVSTQLTQQDVDDYIRNQNFIPPTATMSSFNEGNGKGIAIYKDGNTKFKLIVEKSSLGQINLIFREQQTEINFSNGFVKTSNSQINNFPFPTHQ
jgi:hypothetical protein